MQDEQPPLKLHNTLTRKTEEFTPQDPKNVKIYTCGVTVYSKPHIGNFVAYIYWDLLIRTLKLNGYTPNRVLNYTDVGHLSSDRDEGEDKIEKGAKKEGKTVWEVAEFYENYFKEHFDKLNLIEPEKIAKATDYIKENLDLIAKLREKNITYETSDGIYYDTSKFSEYPDFAKLNLEEQKAGARVEFNEEKRNTADFALWKFVKEREDHSMQWETPEEILENPEKVSNFPLLRKNGNVMGYPGWAIECSSIIHKELGEPIDIHTGGIDHIPVHHTNEIAQSEVAYGKELSRFWLHNKHITVNGTKISKSLGNIITFEDLIEQGFTHMDFKMWALQGKYNSERNFDIKNLTAAKNLLFKWRNELALRHQNKSNKRIGAQGLKNHSTTVKLISDIKNSLNSDLNSPLALGATDDLIFAIGRASQGCNCPQCNIDIENLIDFLDSAFGLNLKKTTPDLSEEQKALFSQYLEALEAKNYELSDKIRDIELPNLGIKVYGKTWGYAK